jgi:hypothetical protein
MSLSPEPGLRLRSTGDVDTALVVHHAGVLVERTSVLTRVERDEVFGEVFDKRGEILETLRSTLVDGVASALGMGVTATTPRPDHLEVVPKSKNTAPRPSCCGRPSLCRRLPAGAQ